MDPSLFAARVSDCWLVGWFVCLFVGLCTGTNARYPRFHSFVLCRGDGSYLYGYAMQFPRRVPFAPVPAVRSRSRTRTMSSSHVSPTQGKDGLPAGENDLGSSASRRRAMSSTSSTAPPVEHKVGMSTSASTGRPQTSFTSSWVDKTVDGANMQDFLVLAKVETAVVFTTK